MSQQQLLETAIAFVDAHNNRQSPEIIGLSSISCRHVRQLSNASDASHSPADSISGSESSVAYAQMMNGLFGRLRGGTFRYHVWVIENCTINQAKRVVSISGFKKIVDEYGEEVMKQCLSTLRMTPDGKKVEFHEDSYL